MPAPLISYFPRQSNKGNWSAQVTLRGSSNTPLWATSALNVVVSIFAVDRTGKSAFEASTADGTGQVSLDLNGIVNINILPGTIGAACEGMHDIHATIVSDDFTTSRIIGRLPIYEGYTSSATSGGVTVGPKVHVWQLKIALINAGVFATVESAILPNTDNQANILWTSGGDTTIGDALYLLVKGILGWNTSQMATLYANASGILSIA